MNRRDFVRKTLAAVGLAGMPSLLTAKSQDAWDLIMAHQKPWVAYEGQPLYYKGVSNSGFATFVGPMQNPPIMNEHYRPYEQRYKVRTINGEEQVYQDEMVILPPNWLEMNEQERGPYLYQIAEMNGFCRVSTYEAIKKVGS